MGIITTGFVIRTVLEFLACILIIFMYAHKDFLLKFEHACWIHFKLYLRRKKMKKR